MLFSLNRNIILSLIMILNGAALFSQEPGDVLWTKFYGGSDYDEANAVLKTTDGGYVFAGFTQSYGLDRWGNAFIGKTDADGDSLFTFHFGGSGNDVLTDVIRTSDNNYAALGFSDSETEFEQLYIIKFNDNGDTLWTKTYGGAVKEIGFSIIETDDNGFMIAGITSSIGSGGEDIWFLRTDSSGDTLWTKTYGSTGNDMAFGMCKTSDGNFAATGLMEDGDMMIMKINTSGEIIWVTLLGGNDFEEGVSIIEADNSDLLAVGHTSSSGAGQLDIYLVRVDAAGEVVFDTTYGSSFYDEGRDILQLDDDEFIIAGNTDQNTPGSTMDYYIISINGEGAVNWEKIIGSADPQRCYDLLDNEDGNFIVAGSYSSGDLEDASLTLMAGSAQTDVNDRNTGPDEFTLFDAYPNPFNPSSVIKYNIPTSGFVTLRVYDILGNEAALLVNEYQNAGTYSFTFDTSEYNLSSGVYFYTLTSGNFSSTKKLIMMK